MKFYIKEEDLQEVSRNGARKVWLATEPGTPDHAGERVLVPESEQARIYLEALEKIRDPRKRDHREPDSYTELGCVMSIANEAIERAKVYDR